MVEKLSIVLGGITVQEVEAVVNAANSSLLGGGVVWMVPFTEPLAPNCSRNAGN